MNFPAQSSLLLRESLDETNYMNSLLDRALELRMIDEGFLREMRRQLRLLLVRQCQAYTGGRSTSVRRETADSLGQSLMFTLNVFLKSAEPLDALAALENRSLEHCYVLGRTRVDSMIRSAELLYLSEVAKPLPDNAQLNSTFLDGIPGFFKLYNPEYGAHEIHITADYPALFYPQGFQGIEFIRKYLDCFCMENRFLRLFDPRDIHRVLTQYAVLNGTTARKLCDNLFLIVLACTQSNVSDLKIPQSGMSEPLRQYVLRACRAYATDLRRIRYVLFREQ